MKILFERFARTSKKLVIALLVMFAAACSDNNSNGVKPIPTLADTLIGNWKLMKITGGWSPSTEVKDTAIIKILNENLECEILIADTLFMNNKITLLYDTVIGVDVIYRRMVMDDSWVGFDGLFGFYSENSSLFLVIGRSYVDGNDYHYKKIK